MSLTRQTSITIKAMYGNSIIDLKIELENAMLMERIGRGTK